MRRRWKVLIAVIGVLAVLLALNTVAVDHETKSAKRTVSGARIISVTGGDLQVNVDGPRRAPPIVLLHCFACSISWWDRITPILARHHRVIRIDLLGHGGSEKPTSGYAMENQARLVSLVLGRLGVSGATVVGHSMGANVAVALAQQSRELVNRIVIVDQPPTTALGHLDLLARISFWPVIGEAIKRTAPHSALKQGLEQAFAPGYDVPDRFVDDLAGMTFTAYRNSGRANRDFLDARALERRAATTHLPVLAIYGSEDQIADEQGAIERWRRVPGARTALVEGAGHSPQVEKPRQTARLILRFAGAATASGRRPSPTRPGGRRRRSHRAHGSHRGGEPKARARRRAAHRSASR